MCTRPVTHFLCLLNFSVVAQSSGHVTLVTALAVPYFKSESQLLGVFAEENQSFGDGAEENDKGGIQVTTSWGFI